MACLLTLFSFTAAVQAASTAPQEIALTGTVERFISIDNVCAWPNLTAMPDGSITAAIFNRPSHGQEEGSIDIWGSADGRFWEKRGTAAPNKPQTNRMHVAIGLANNRDLVALVTGFTNIQQPGQDKKLPFRDKYGEKKAGRRTHFLMPAWVCRSRDGGRTWTQVDQFPAPPEGWSTFIPYGDIVIGADGALHATCYSSKTNAPVRTTNAWHFRSDDDGKTWRATSIIGTSHNETDLFHLGGKKWLAASRTVDTVALDLFRSDDDGATWSGRQKVAGVQQMPADLVRLSDGRLLLTYGNRVAGQFGVQAKLSRDNGMTWSIPIRLAHSVGRDCGYPSSIQRPDGSIVTAYYSAGVENHSRYHMGVVIWTPPAPNP